MSIIIAVDGPAASGKSSVCAKVAEMLDMNHISTGSIYRALAYFVAERHIMTITHEHLHQLVDSISHQNGKWFLDHIDITPFLNEARVSARASAIAKEAIVREALLPLQRSMALSSPKGTILDGRDVGSVIFPRATLKIFLTATPGSRAKRRLLQLPEGTCLAEVEKDLEKRDTQDQTRSIAPLVQPEDAVLLDTSALSFDEVVEAVMGQIRRVMDRDMDEREQVKL